MLYHLLSLLIFYHIISGGNNVGQINGDLTPEEISLLFTQNMATNAGKIVPSRCILCGKIIQYQFGVALDKDIAAGGHFDITGNKYPPINTLSIVNDGRSTTLYADPNGTINIGNTSVNTWNAGRTVYINGVYMTK